MKIKTTIEFSIYFYAKEAAMLKGGSKFVLPDLNGIAVLT